MTKSLVLEAFAKKFKPILYRRKERIIVPGTKADDVYFISQGYVMQGILSPNGNIFTPYIFSPGSFFPLIWEENGGQSDKDDHEYESLTPVEVYRIPREELMLFLKENPKALFLLNERLKNYSGVLLKKLETRIFSDAFHIVILGLLDLAKLFGKTQSKQVVIDYWFTHQDIANISGLSREVVTKEMSKLMKKKLIKYKNHLIAINDLQNLKMELES